MQGVADFVHLHVHTEYSLLDGMIRIKDLVDKAASFQMPAVAMTDHGSLFGAVKFYKAAQDKGMKPIIGCEVYVAPNSRLDRDQVGHHLVLLCKNHKGYQNLCTLVSKGYLEGFYYKPRIDVELLKEYNEGLIALSACLKGEIPQALLEDDQKRAAKAAGRFKEIFNGGRFYLELQENGIPDQRRVNVELLSLGKKLGIPPVATNDCHYLTREMARAHEVLVCLQTGKTLADEKRMKMSTDEFYFRSPGEMKEKFAEVPEAISNTLEIAGRCNFDWKFGQLHFPRFETPDDMSVEKFLAAKAEAGFEERMAEMKLADPKFDERREEYRKRFDHELKVITEMGFAGYFLIVSDFITWAKKNKIPVGPGRGSAAGSLISYCVGITDLNPLAYGLLFERFLNPQRREMPDVDVDFCQERRGEVIRYVTDKYGGSERVAQIITFGTMKAKAAIRDVARVLGMPYGEADQISKLVPERLGITLAQAMEQEPRLIEMRKKDPRVDELLTLAQALEGVSRHASTHAAGVVISDKPLVEYVPLYNDQKSPDVVVQYDMKSVEKVGLVKIDLLGLKTLTQIRYCVDFIKANRGVDIDVSKLPLDDEKTFAVLSKGDTNGVFQFESSGMKDLLIRLQPTRIEELIAANALYRPGPIQAGYLDKFIERKHGRQAVEYLLKKEMEPVLKETYGVLVYQEQVMEMAVRVAGYNLGEADSLRKAMGKKDAALMASQREKFLTGAAKNNISAEKARLLFEDMEKFAEYGFNKSHAAAYVLVAFQTAYLKTHYPVEFMASLLTIDMGDTDKVARYVRDCDDMKIPIEPPHVNHSRWHFGPQGESIRFGLGAIKGVGQSAVEAVVEEREKNGPYASIFDFCARADLKRINRRTLESLVKAGAFDGTGPDRCRIFAAVEGALDQGHKAAGERESGQGSLFDILGQEEKAKIMTGQYPEATPWTPTELLSYEKEALGIYLTGHPLARYADLLRMYATTDTAGVPFLTNNQEVLIGGIVVSRKETTTKKKGKNERMGFITLADLKSNIEVVVFSSVYMEALPYLEKEDMPLLVRGRIELSEDKAKLLASEIFPLEEAHKRVSVNVHLTLNRPYSTPEQVDYVAGLLRNHQGKSRVFIHVMIPNHSETVIAMPRHLWVAPDRELIKSLEEVLGEGTVKLVAA